MKDLMKIRLRCDGPEAWKFRFEDAETGKLLPVMDFTIDVKDHVMTVNCTLMVSEVEIDGVINLAEMVKQLTAEPEPETVDGWAERTVSLIIGGGDA